MDCLTLNLTANVSGLDDTDRDDNLYSLINWHITNSVETKKELIHFSTDAAFLNVTRAQVRLAQPSDCCVKISNSWAWYEKDKNPIRRSRLRRN